MNGIQLTFAGTMQEAYTRAHNLAEGLTSLLGNQKFSVRVDRTDRAASGYEVGPDGHSVHD